MVRAVDASHEVRALRDRERVLSAIVAAQESMDLVVQVASEAEDPDDARQALQDALGVDEVQATAVLDMQIRRLSARERQRLIEELSSIRAEIAELPPDA